MKEEKMLRAIGGIDDDMVEDAAIHPSHRKQSLVRMPAFRRVVAIAACFVLIIGLAFSMPTLLNPNYEGPGVPIRPNVPVDPTAAAKPVVNLLGKDHAKPFSRPT